MNPSHSKPGIQPWFGFVGDYGVGGGASRWLARAIMPWQTVFPDYIHHWTAGMLIANGKSPYDEILQLRTHRDLGWDRSTQGRGILSFLPYYYPPWFALACTLLVPLGYEGGKVAWFFLNLEMLFGTGFLLRNAVPGLPRSIPLVAVPFFLFSLLALFIGQTPILILFLSAVALRLVEGGWDRAGGAALACLTTKPQLAAIVVLAVGIWAVRQRRWGVVKGFVCTLALLCLASTLIVPSWPIEMIRAPRNTPPPTEVFPWLGNTWFLILRTLGLRSWALWAVYLAVALPFLGGVVRSAGDQSRTLREVIALGSARRLLRRPLCSTLRFCRAPDPGLRADRRPIVGEGRCAGVDHSHFGSLSPVHSSGSVQS